MVYKCFQNISKCCKRPASIRIHNTRLIIYRYIYMRINIHTIQITTKKSQLPQVEKNEEIQPRVAASFGNVYTNDFNYLDGELITFFY